MAVRNVCRAVCVALVAWVAACARDAGDDPFTRYVEQQHLFPTFVNRDVDVLFVIGNGPSMVDQQTLLATNLRQFADALATAPGDPNYHIGVVSTDLGTGPYSHPGCVDDGAVLQNEPRQPGCMPPAGRFLRDVGLPDGTRDRNYTGTLEDALHCIGVLGADGCRFPQPLEAMRRALDGTVAENSGFVREDALLLVVIVAPVDDCSARSPQLFDTSQTTIDDPLGPAKPFRCFEFGVVCNPDNARSTGAKSECAPREDSQLVHPVQTYVDFLKQLKAPRPQEVIVAGIMGVTDPVIVGVDFEGEPKIEPSCQSAAGTATPGIRLRTFAEAFPQRNTVTTICQDEWSSATTVLIDLLRVFFRVPCLRGPLVDIDPAAPELQPLCSVSEIRNPTGANRSEELMSSCDRPGEPEESTNHPCYLLTRDMTCGTTGLRFEYFPGDTAPPPNAVVSVRCLAPEDTSPAPPCGAGAPCPEDWLCVEPPEPYRWPRCVRPCGSDDHCDLGETCSGRAPRAHGCRGFFCLPVRYCEYQCAPDELCPGEEP